MFINSGSQLGMIFVPTGHLAMSGDILIVMTSGQGGGGITDDWCVERITGLKC